ncbi:NAD(P)-dependent oxidoreductase [Iodobacter sp. CM08]|uniref:NAD-dependent epimerase/dehydratase family protein n=1 Tax=Iodobacter sp. CM08 TaxID=3085902 RepID=UPI00298180DA|nr:NAD(P)-dependent oxidoreductase [Iodobacter sp. CM08]MDW5417301.1 NAD(P)-dependent oxidoreductase [Iodobacter sp. CM08]
MKVLLTGASGFLGRYVLQALHRQNVPVLELGRRHSGQDLGTEFIYADLQEASDLGALLKDSGATHLLHLAWCTEHGKFWTAPANLAWVNITLQLLEAFCAQGGKHVTVGGTCAEYDWSYGYCDEDKTPLIPATLYGVCKDATRRIIMARCEYYQIPCAWGRVFLPYGHGENSQRLIPALIDIFQGKRAAFGVNSNVYRDFLHASDVADGFITLLKHHAYGAFNISSAEPVQIRDLVIKIAGSLNADPQRVLGLPAQRQGEPHLLLGDNSKLMALGWQHKISILQDLKLLPAKA